MSLYHWVYGLKDKSEANQAAEPQLEDGYDIYIANQCATCVANIDSTRRGNAGKSNFDECRSPGIYWISGCADYVSVAYELHQNGLAESSINSIMLLNWTQMVESGLIGVFWYRALVTAEDERNVIDHDQIKTTEHYFVRSVCPNFGHSVVRWSGIPCLNEDSSELERGKHIPRAIEGVNLGFSQECRG